MKEELIKYVMGKADDCYSDDFPILSIEHWIREFFDQYQPERLSEKTVNGLNAFNESMKVYEDCLSKPIPNEMKKLFCGSDSLNSMET